MAQRTRETPESAGIESMLPPARITEVVDSDAADRFDAEVARRCQADAEFRRQWSYRGRGRR
jgi:hypothetical protein